MNGTERGRRHLALGVLGFMMIIFIALSAFSFLGSRDQVTPDTVTYASFEATAGKRVFQAYNCMGCHTLVGNGAYFGPDLTNVYQAAGPAWLASFLPSAGRWPTQAAVRTQLQNPDQLADTGLADLDAYLAEYPGAKERIERRGGGATFMPTLALSGDEVGQLIAFLKYTSRMNTEGWPPVPKVDGLEHPVAARASNAAEPRRFTAGPPAAAAVGVEGRPGGAAPAEAAATAASAAGRPAADTAAAGSQPATDAAATGAGVAQEYGCVSCHASDGSRLVGPGWGGLYGSEATLADGSRVPIDDAYLAESIREPNAHVAEGYPAGVMPAYGSVLSDGEIDALVAYIRSLEAR